MVFKDYQCIGYHGTTKLAAELIIKSNEFFVSDNSEDWLGKGVYFFEDDINQAINFISKARKVKDYKIIKAKIKSDRWIDLVKNENYLYLLKIADEIKKRNIPSLKGYKLVNAVVIDFMHQIEEFDIISATFEIEKSSRCSGMNIMPMQIQICVKNTNCISDIEEVGLVV